MFKSVKEFLKGFFEGLDLDHVIFFTVFWLGIWSLLSGNIPRLLVCVIICFIEWILIMKKNLIAEIKLNREIIKIQADRITDLIFELNSINNKGEHESDTHEN